MTTRRTGLASSTVSALRAIAAAILAKPEIYHQNSFVSDFENERERGCIAFHYAKLYRTARQLKNLFKKHIARSWAPDLPPKASPFFIAAKKDLKLTDAQAILLLSGHEKWPRKHKDAYENAKTDKGRARALYNFIEFFIKTNGTCMTDRELKAAEKAKAAEKVTTELDCPEDN